MEKRKGLRDQFLAKIGKFTEHAQVQCPEKNLTKALVLTKGLQDGQQAIEHSLDQRWWESFSNDDSKSKKYVTNDQAEFVSDTLPVHPLQATMSSIN